MFRRNKNKQANLEELSIGGPSGFRSGAHISVDRDSGSIKGVPKELSDAVKESSNGYTVEEDVAGEGELPEVLRLSRENDLDKGRGGQSGSLKKNTLKKSMRAPPANDDFVISGPHGPAHHKVHVDQELKWSGEDVFEKGEKLGQGAYGAVYKGTHKDTGLVIAIKTVPAVGKQAESIEKEVNILRRLQHPNTVQYIGCMLKDNLLWIMMEMCATGSAADVLNKLKPTPPPASSSPPASSTPTSSPPASPAPPARPADPPTHVGLDEPVIAAIMLSATKGLVYLHEKGIIHRDIKAGNILLTADGEAKLADFGVSAQMKEQDGKQKTTIGTPLWMAPEVLSGSKYGNKADIWSLGITAMELAEGVPPHHTENLMRAMFLIANEVPPTLKGGTDLWSAEFVDFLSICLQKDAESRPSASELLKCTFLMRASLQNPRAVLEQVAMRMRGEEVPSLSASNSNNNSKEVSTNANENSNSSGESGKKGGGWGSGRMPGSKSQSDEISVEDLKSQLLQTTQELAQERKASQQKAQQIRMLSERVVELEQIVQELREEIEDPKKKKKDKKK